MMNDLQNQFIDVLRGYSDLLSNPARSRSYSVSFVVQNYFRYRKSEFNVLEIERKIDSEGLSQLEDPHGKRKFAIKEGALNKYLDPYNTDEYIIDRCMDLLLKEHMDGVTFFDRLLGDMKIKLPDLKKKLLESIVAASSLVTCTYPSRILMIELNHTGVIALNKFKAYSDFLKHSQDQKKKERENQKVILNMNKIIAGRDVTNTNITQDSDLSESPTTQSVSTTPKVNESAIKIPWYKMTLFTEIVGPVLAMIIFSILLFVWSKFATALGY